MRATLEVVILPVMDVERALAFYRDQAGFALDVDYAPSNDFRVVQLTPPGSSCSIQVGLGLTTAAPGSVQGLQLVVDDVEDAHLPDDVRRQVLRDEALVPEVGPDLPERAVGIAIAGIHRWRDRHP